MRFDEIELRIIRLPYRHAFKTSFANESEKVAVITTVRSDGVEGYGEGVMDPLPLYREETIAGAMGLLEEVYRLPLVPPSAASREKIMTVLQKLKLLGAAARA